MNSWCYRARRSEHQRRGEVPDYRGRITPRMRRNAVASGRRATADGGADLLAFLVHHRSYRPSEALGLTEHRGGDNQAHHPDDDGYHQEPTKDRMIAHNLILPQRLVGASVPNAIHPARQRLSRAPTPPGTP